jgi:FtsP/CotA-like multicopper oxidase with cupredoxin domain
MGTDGGLIPEPYSSDFLQVAVGQRFDLEIRYTDPALATVQSWVFSVNEAGDVVQVPIEVTNITLTETAEAPTVASWPAAEPLPIREVNAEGWLEFDAVEDPITGIKWTINGESMPMEPVLTYWQGDTVNLALFNRLGPEHPFHLHGQFFEIIRRNGQLVYDEPGLKDTVLIPGKESVHVRAYMDNPGSWMAHCHIPAHAKLGMMGEVLVLPVGQ